MLLQTSDVKIKKISDKKNVGVFEFSPLPSGFGRTLGNSLRRVLLTSLEGGAVTEVRIPKVTHQFTTLPGLKEDIVELTLNLKNIVPKMHSEGPIVGTISKKGKGSITAADLDVPSDVEIVNKDLYIGELADAKSSLEMEVTFGKGAGYSPVENRKSSKVGVILIDASYSPVKNVSFIVEDTRMGEVTGLDKLTITVETNGSVDPEDAIVEAATHIRNFFSRFAQGPDPVEEAKALEEEAAASGPKEEIFLEDLNLPTRTINALKKNGIETLRSLASLTDDELADIKNLGEKSVKEIKKILEKEGLN